MVLVDLTKTELRRILSDLHRPFVYEIQMKKPHALAWQRLDRKLTKALKDP